jgi:hypothetical protein
MSLKLFQPTLPFGTGYRTELPIAVVSWRDHAGRRDSILYPHCIDHDWPWWRPTPLVELCHAAA